MLALAYPLIPIGSGLVMLWWALWELRLLVSLRGRGARTTATVVGYAETGRSSQMVVRFRAEDGSEVETTHSSGGWAAGRVGDEVEVAYDTAAPQRARIVRGAWLSDWVPRMIATTGGMLVLIGLLLGYLAWL